MIDQELYELCRQTAEQSSISFTGYHVWSQSFTGAEPELQSQDREPCVDFAEALDWAKRLSQLKNVFITGPGKQQLLRLPDFDRYPPGFSTDASR